ncbi:MAG: hypothetical protein R6V62_00220 [Candidatus Fermentibacteraceae bacterium]
MTDPMELQRRYFTAQLEKYGSKPQLHRALIEDCHHYLEMLEEAGSPGAFMERVRQTGNMVSSAKANAADRYANRAHIYDMLGHEGKAEEDRQRLIVIESAETHADLSRKLEDFEAGTSMGMNENRAINAVVPMVEALFHLCTDNPGGDDQNRSLVKFREYRRQMCEADPGFTWHRLMTHSPYRDLLPFTDRQMAFLEEKYTEFADG